MTRPEHATEAALAQNPGGIHDFIELVQNDIDALPIRGDTDALALVPQADKRKIRCRSD